VIGGAGGSGGSGGSGGPGGRCGGGGMPIPPGGGGGAGAGGGGAAGGGAATTVRPECIAWRTARPVERVVVARCARRAFRCAAGFAAWALTGWCRTAVCVLDACAPRAGGVEANAPWICCRSAGSAAETTTITAAVAANFAAAPPTSDFAHAAREPRLPSAATRERSSLRASERRARKSSVSTAASVTPSSWAISR